ncbi:MAG: 23S rRNA (uracil(1939)-C(5))-methyltransferase RlmD [Defluviitaleaceae bacterium]|nr:23S rRNA (uracil(1939)-C(5))-methyltransferase RlmD [Defluviitaleaceae bacterium]
MLTKNQFCDIEITGLTSDGLGVGKHEGFPVFVKGAAPGDALTVKIIKVKRGYAYGKIESFAQRASTRVEPVCAVFGRCGGCSLQHISYDAQLAAKKGKLEDCLRRIGGFAEIQANEVIGARNSLRYRNKSVFPIGKDENGRAVCGLYAANSHRLVPVQDCHIAHKGVAAVLRTFETFMNANGISVYNEETNTGLVRHIMVRTAFATGQVMAVVVINGDTLPRSETLIELLREIDGMTSICLNINRTKTNVIMGQETRVIWGEPSIKEILCGNMFEISAPSFFQVNPEMTEILYSKVLELSGVRTHETVIDAYCGIGTISLVAARHAARVIGVEVVQAAIDDARTNAKLNGAENVEFIAGKTEEVLAGLLKDDSCPDVVILDPPRKGCEPGVIEALQEHVTGRVVYVSCDPATLARDLKLLCAEGLYKIEKVVAVDTFPQTMHIESVVLLTGV